MKRIISIALISFFILNNYMVKAQDITVSQFDKNEYVYWFYIKAEIKKDKVLKVPVYKVRRSSKDIKAGKIKKFQNDVWRNIKGGNQLVIGPFQQLVDAERANAMYNIGRKTDTLMAQEIKATQDTVTYNDYYAYLLTFKFSDRTHKYLIKRQAAGVFETTLPDFKSQLWDFLKQKQLVIGPFTTQMEAEESKRLYRLEESYDGESERDNDGF